MREAQCGERMGREDEIHDGFCIAHDGRMDRIDLHKHSGGGSVVVYGQTKLTRDLYEARDRMKGVVLHHAEDVQPGDLTSPTPCVTYRDGDEIVRIDCDYVIGADGFHRCVAQGDPEDRAEGIREGLPPRLAGRAVAHQAGVARTGRSQA